jgi:hypothetical protein
VQEEDVHEVFVSGQGSSVRHGVGLGFQQELAAPYGISDPDPDGELFLAMPESLTLCAVRRLHDKVWGINSGPEGLLP